MITPTVQSTGPIDRDSRKALEQPNVEQVRLPTRAIYLIPLIYVGVVLGIINFLVFDLIFDVVSNSSIASLSYLIVIMMALFLSAKYWHPILYWFLFGAAGFLMIFPHLFELGLDLYDHLIFTLPAVLFLVTATGGLILWDGTRHLILGEFDHVPGEPYLTDRQRLELLPAINEIERSRSNNDAASIIKRLNDPSTANWVRIRAAYALGFCDSEEGRYALGAALGDENRIIREMCRIGLRSLMTDHKALRHAIELERGGRSAEAAAEFEKLKLHDKAKALREALSPEPAVTAAVQARSKRPERAPIRLLSEYDYYEGFIRLKVGVVNNDDTVITDSRVRILFDENFMQISHIEPDLPLQHDEVTIGTVNPVEKKTVTFFLDPLICQNVNVDGTLIYKDSKGKLNTLQMRSQPIGISCPIYATPESINTATAINLAKKVLRHKDSRIYSFPKTLSSQKALQIAQQIIQKRNVKHVSDLKIKKGFGVMSYYYGRSKTDNRQYVIRTTILEEGRSLELFVAGDDETMLAGELAKLGQDLSVALCEEAKICEPIRHVNITIKDSVLNRTNFLFGEGEEIPGNIEISESVITRSRID